MGKEFSHSFRVLGFHVFVKNDRKSHGLILDNKQPH